ncbi:50S ribosomal protein L1 [Fibrobacterota bacterium]
MKKRGKKYREFLAKIEKGKAYEVSEAVQLIKDNCKAKVNDTIEVHMKLGVDPKHADQVVRGNVVLPHGTGQKVRILVFAKGDLAKTAEEAGADYVGAEDLVAKIQEGWLDFDKAVASPDMMPVVGRVARILGPRGMMPNPKSGTVVTDIAKAISELKAGKVSYRVDKGSNIHASVGKAHFDSDKLEENIKVMIDSVVKARPVAAKGEYINSIYLAVAMSPSIMLSKAVTR